MAGSTGLGLSATEKMLADEEAKQAMRRQAKVAVSKPKVAVPVDANVSKPEVPVEKAKFGPSESVKTARERARLKYIEENK